MLSSTVCKRSRPLLGTFVTIELECENAFEICTDLFAQAAAFENRFSLFSPDSEISRFNRAAFGEFDATREFLALARLASEISQVSAGAFRLTPLQINETSITKTAPEPLDLNGIAKGALVDLLCETVISRAPHARGMINAGGDLRALSPATFQLKLGTFDYPLRREIEIGAESMASSSLTVAENDPWSNTRYPLTLRFGLSAASTAVVLAEKCSIADALTKVALFAELEITQRVAEKFAARILIFDSEGALTETYGNR